MILWDRGGVNGDGTFSVLWKGVSMNNRRSIQLFFIIFIVSLTVYVSSIVIKRVNSFNYASDIDKAVLTLDGRPITLRELGYYIAEVEDFTQKQAVLYDPDDPLVYWNLYFSARENSTFVSDYARETAINNCLADIIYENRALEEGITLTEAMSDAAEEDATLFYVCLSDEQRAAVGLTKEMTVEIEKRKQLASAYITSLLASDRNLSSMLEDMANEKDPPVDPVSLLSGTGDYFKESILPQYKVTYNRKILRKLPLGRITVNQEW